MDVSVVIPAHNAEPYLAAQLEKILAADFPGKTEILVVDNLSTDGTAAVIERFCRRDPRVRRVGAAERPGVNYARNTGVLAARYPYILVFDADDLIDPDLLPDFINLFRQADLLGAGHRQLVWDPVTADYRPGEIRREAPVTPAQEPYAMGAAMGFTRSLFLRIGGFDESYVGGHDEVDFAVRAYAAGAEFGWLDQPLISYRQRNSLRASLRQKFHYARTSVQLVLNCAPRFDFSLPGYRLLVRKELAALNRVRTQWAGRHRQHELEGLAWTSGRLYGALLYRLLKRLPARQLLEETAGAAAGGGRAPVKVGFLTSWDMDDEYSWSGVCYRAVRALEERCETRRLPIPRVKDAAVDRLLAKLLGRLGLVYLPNHALCTAIKRSLVARRLVTTAPPQTLVAFAASTESLLLPRKLPVVQVTDSSFAAVADTYFSGEPKLSCLSLWQGKLIDRWAGRRSGIYSLASNWSREVVRRDLNLPSRTLILNPFGPGTLPRSLAEPYRGGTLKIIFIGSDWERKGGEDMLRALHQVRSSRDIEVTVVGQEHRKLPCWVRSLPRLNREQLSAEYADHHLLIELSTASAGGVVATDALAHGLATLAADTGGLKTIVRSNGWRVPVRDWKAAADLLAGLTRQDISGAQAEARRLYREEINWERWAQRILDMG